jgi:hypothetical protein
MTEEHKQPEISALEKQELISELLDPDTPLERLEEIRFLSNRLISDSETEVTEYSTWQDDSDTQLVELLADKEVSGDTKDKISKFVLQRSTTKKPLPPDSQ